MHASHDPDLARRVEEVAAAAVTSIRVMDGGHSGITHVVELDRGDRRESLVVKSAPAGRRAVGRHDVLRQARILDALRRANGPVVPRVVLRDASEPAWFAAELLAGVATDPVIEPPYPDESEELVRTRWDRAIALLAQLHATPLDALDLASEPVREPAAELEVWAATMGAARLEDEIDAKHLTAAMRKAPPRTRSAAVVHGDFRLGNILFDGETARGIIDWEIWSVGDPAVDLAWFVQFTDPENFPGIGRAVPGTPTVDEVLDAYARVGRDIGSDGDWYVALGCFKLAAIQAHNRRRHLDGRHHDPYQERLGPSIARLLEVGLTRVA